jgi:hypothetical protein
VGFLNRYCCQRFGIGLVRPKTDASATVRASPATPPLLGFHPGMARSDDLRSRDPRVGGRWDSSPRPRDYESHHIASTGRLRTAQLAESPPLTALSLSNRRSFMARTMAWRAVSAVGCPDPFCAPEVISKSQPTLRSRPRATLSDPTAGSPSMGSDSPSRTVVSSAQVTAACADSPHPHDTSEARSRLALPLLQVSPDGADTLQVRKESF